MRMLHGLSSLALALVLSFSGFSGAALAEEQLPPKSVRDFIEIDIKGDDHIEIKVTHLIKKEAAEKSGYDVTNMCGNIASCENISEDGYVGYRILGINTLDLEDSFVRHDGDRYTVNIFEGAASGFDFSSQSNVIESIELKITFPGEIISHEGNAEIDGNTITWNDPKDFADKKAIATGKDGSSIKGGGSSKGGNSTQGGGTSTNRNPVEESSSGSFLWKFLVGAFIISAAAVAGFFLLKRQKSTPQYYVPGQQPYGSQPQQSVSPYGFPPQPSQTFPPYGQQQSYPNPNQQPTYGAQPQQQGFYPGMSDYRSQYPQTPQEYGQQPQCANPNQQPPSPWQP